MLPHVVVGTAALGAVEYGDADTSVHTGVDVARGTVVACDVAHGQCGFHQVVHRVTVNDDL